MNLRHLFAVLAAFAALAISQACATSDPVIVPETRPASSPLSYAATRVYSLSAANFGQSWCPHGSVATDAAARCNDPTQTVFARLPIAYDGDANGSPDPCYPVEASLTFQREEWSAPATIDVRAVLRPTIDPPEGIAAACAPAGVAAWDGSGSALWTVPGARGWGTDASAEAFSIAVPSDGTKTVTVDLTARDANGLPIGTLVDDCAPLGGCLLGLYASAHVWEYPGTFSLFVTCEAAPPGGGGSGGGGTAGAGGASGTTSSSGGAGGGCP